MSESIAAWLKSVQAHAQERGLSVDEVMAVYAARDRELERIPSREVAASNGVSGSLVGSLGS